MSKSLLLIVVGFAVAIWLLQAWIIMLVWGALASYFGFKTI
jgi:hypothetical protein